MLHLTVQKEVTQTNRDPPTKKRNNKRKGDCYWEGWGHPKSKYPRAKMVIEQYCEGVVDLSLRCTPPKANSSPLKMAVSNRNLIFQGANC